MKKIKNYIALILLAGLLSCTKHILVRNIGETPVEMTSFNKNLGNHYYIDMEISDSLEFVWKNDVHGSFLGSSVIFYNDNVFVSDLAGRVYCFQDSTGKLVGAEKYKGEVAVSPMIYGNTLLFGLNLFKENYSSIIFYDFLNGDVTRQVDLAGNIVNEFIKTEGHFAVLTQAGVLLKYDKIGKKIWEYDSGSITICTPYMVDDKIYFGNVNGELICVDYNSGDELWRTDLTDGIESTPVKSGNRIIVCDTNGKIICYDENNNLVLWEYDTNSGIKSQPLIIDNYVLVGNLSGDFYSIDLNDGSENWKLTLGGVINATPLAFRNLLFQPDLNKKVFLIDYRAGEVLKELPFDGRVRMSPAFYRNKIYFGADRGFIHTYRVRPL